MKALNTMKFMTTATMEFKSQLDDIGNATDWTEARARANRANGYLDCMTVFLNTMICTENNGFTGDLGAQIDDWRADVYQAIINLTDKEGFATDTETLWSWLKHRDEFRDSAKSQWDAE